MTERNKIWFSRNIFTLVVLTLTIFMITSAYASMIEPGAYDSASILIQGNDISFPNAQQRVHRASGIQACMTNWGTMGSQRRGLNESMGGCFNPTPDQQIPAPSFEYPPGSGIEYLFNGGLWIGAKVNNKPYTTVGCDGWYWIYEMWPDAGDWGAIRERSIKSNGCYSEDAISDQDIIAVYTDTSADIPLSPTLQDPWDSRMHHPLGVRVTQKSYSWEEEDFDKFIIAEYNIKNIGTHLLSDVYIGFFMDADIMHISENPYGQFGGQDDITGFLRMYQGDTVNIAWAADNDGHGIADEVAWTSNSPRSVIGMKVLHKPNPNIQMAYNWWVSNQSGYPKDWGPWKQENRTKWAQENCYVPGDSLFPDHALGTPGGDCSKYFLLSNGETDYNQIYSCIWPGDHLSEGWLPPSPQCTNIANGLDIRFILSLGPFSQLDPGDSLDFAVAYIIGKTLHVDPDNGDNLPNNPDAFYSNLHFEDLVHNALLAEKVYHDILFHDPPDAFSLLIPWNKAVTPRIVHFDWEKTNGPNPSEQVIYDLYVSTSRYFSPDSTTIDSNSVETEHTKKLDYGIYYWKVKAKDNHGGERWSSETRRFTNTGLPYSNLGDLNQDGGIDVGDVVYSINYLFRLGSSPDPLESGDVNCDDNVDIGDVVFLINYLFKNGYIPLCP